jgi:hypothetical protein
METEAELLHLVGQGLEEARREVLQARFREAAELLRETQDLEERWQRLTAVVLQGVRVDLEWSRGRLRGEARNQLLYLAIAMAMQASE